ncbi:hypothetical protein [Porphyromonas circumdentaria]|uniref:Uncharacterized protein n=1 Tax=Porphyromonas circumdentaria TaxID=29524 RepID=A0A1T4NZT3_9PORP|nr:hypothetical protein [Porphyromonas circumdentaria]MBB6276249.1 hypothetical protein [Porphyromonas circumdentaria]SJZ84689.1 hypothetical protein SAMN02745171_01280 [Porphyromonas circumdentaria]
MRKILFIYLCLLFLTPLFAQNRGASGKKTSIKEIFLMLPDDALDNRLPQKERKRMLTTIGQRPEFKEENEDSNYTYIEVCDERNGYMSVFYYYPEGYKYEICYWNLKDGKKLVAVNQYAGFGDVTFYLYEAGKLRLAPSYAPETKKVQVEDFFDTSLLNKKEKELLTELFNKRVVFEFSLPRRGTTIEMHLGSIPFDMEYETMFLDAGFEDKLQYKHVLFEWVNQTWKKKVKNGI